MGKKLSELNQQNSATQEEYLLIDKDNQNESYKIKLKDIDIANFLRGYLVGEIEEAKNELGGTSLYEGIQSLFDNVPHTHFTNRITSNNTTQAPTVKAVYDYILENGGGGGGGTGTGGSGIKEKVDNPKLWELTSGMYEVTSGFYYTIDNYQSLENTSAILFIGDDSPEQDINYFIIAGRVKYYGTMKIDGSDGTIVTEDFTDEEISESSTNKDIPSSKAVYDFVINKTKTKRFNNPKLWELEEGWSYITQGFYYGEGENDYFALVGAVVIYKPYNANTSCSFYGLGNVYNSQTNLISGSIDYINNKWQGYYKVSRFIEEIDAGNPSNRDYPSEKAVVDFVTSYVNTEKQIPVVQNPNLWELENGWYYISDGFYLDENNYIELHPEALVYIYTNHPYYNFYGWELTGTEFFGNIEDTESGHNGYINRKDLTKTVNENSTDEQYPTAKSVFDFVKTETKIPVLENPNLWELKPGYWYYIYNGFYYGSDQYQTITDGMLFITGNIEWSYILITTQGKFWGTFKVENNKVVGTCNKELFTAQININSPTDEKYPSEKAVIDYVKEQINNLVDTAPETLNTLNELANALNNDENFASTVMEQIGKKVDKTSIKTEIDENSTDENIASSKAIYEFINKAMENSQGIKVVANPKIWELEPGLYRVQKGFYHSNEKEINDKINNNPSTEAPGQTTEDYKNIGNHEMLLLVYKESSVTAKPNAICDFLVFGDGTYTYSGEIWMDMPMIGEDTYIAYHSNLLILSKTNLIDENSTNEQYPSAKAVYDFVNNNASRKKYITSDVSMLDLETNIYEIEVDNSVMLTFTDDKTLELSEGLIINNSYELNGDKANYGLILGNMTSGEPVYIYYLVSKYVAETTNILMDYALDKEVDVKISALENNVYKKQYLETDTLLTDLDTGIYTVNYMSPINLTVSVDKIIKIIAGNIFNQKNEVYYEDVLVGYLYQGLITGTYNTDDSHNGVIYYCAIIDTEGVVTITEFTDLNEDFIKKENITKEISSSSTHSQIPTAKAVYENLEQKSQVQIITWEEND